MSDHHEGFGGDELRRLHDELLASLRAMLRWMAENDDVFKDVAVVYRKMVTALQAEGFTESQAITIVAHQGIGTMNIQSR